MPLQLLLIALATFASEDLTCIATGVLVSQGHLGFFAGTLACLTGIFCGDLLLFLTGRLFGRSVSHWVPADKLASAGTWLAARGSVVIFLSRFTPGLRLPTYLAAGFLRGRFWQFAAYLLLAATVWTPLLVGATVLFGDRFLKSSNSSLLVGAVAAMVLGLRSISSSRRRRLIGSLRRIVRWEFWPSWLAYLPLIPYFLLLAIKHRSITLFTAANPGIPGGGLVGESKSDILTRLSGEHGAVAEFALLSSEKMQHAEQFMKDHALEFPVVLKPDVGERGAGVAVIRSREELRSYLDAASGDTIIQRYIGGMEFGLFYYRLPDKPRGAIFSITLKQFPSLEGDGRSTLAELTLRDSRAVCMASIYRQSCKAPMDSVPACGERVQLVELGSHCRGAVFLDGGQYRTPALEEAVDRVSKAYAGFYFGRYDVRTPSLEALRNGEFRVIELNGVSSEATHVYDPAVSVWEAYRVMFRQWALAFEIGARNCEAGARPMRVVELIRLCLERKLPPVQNQNGRRANENDDSESEELAMIAHGRQRNPQLR